MAQEHDLFDDIIEDVYKRQELGLPVTMKELGVAELTREQAMIVAEAACAPDDTCLLYTSRCV